MRYSIKLKTDGKTASYLLFRNRMVWTKKTALKHARNYKTAFPFMGVSLVPEFIYADNGDVYLDLIIESNGEYHV